MSDSATLESVLQSQASLLQEAALALPHQFSQCTYSLGHIRQAVYLCLTCTPTSSSPRGICSACSVACHTDHDQLELFPKRAFRCDCPTSALSHSCALHTHLEMPNQKNQYGRNFKAQFCRCGRTYDAENERETMIQCVACEDWFHESCLHLRERPPSRESTPVHDSDAPVDDGASDASSSGLPPPLIPGDDYDALVCGACVRSIDALRRVAGTPGALMVMRSAEDEPWQVIGRDEHKESAPVDIAIDSKDTSTEEVPSHPHVPSAGEKRERSASIAGAEEPQPKKARVSPELETPSCLAPSQDPRVQDSLDVLGSNAGDTVNAESTVKHGRFHGSGDVFLVEGWRDRWCRCKDCLPSLQAHPYLLEEEETYEPPDDPDSGLSLEELGMRALQHLPRERAINGIMAFNAMRDDLMVHLRQFAQRGEEVTETDVRSFFDARMQELQSKRK